MVQSPCRKNVRNQVVETMLFVSYLRGNHPLIVSVDAKFLSQHVRLTCPKEQQVWRFWDLFSRYGPTRGNQKVKRSALDK